MRDIRLRIPQTPCKTRRGGTNTFRADAKTVRGDTRAPKSDSSASADTSLLGSWVPRETVARAEGGSFHQPRSTGTVAEVEAERQEVPRAMDHCLSRSALRNDDPALRASDTPLEVGRPRAAEEVRVPRQNARDGRMSSFACARWRTQSQSEKSRPDSSISL